MLGCFAVAHALRQVICSQRGRGLVPKRWAIRSRSRFTFSGTRNEIGFVAIQCTHCMQTRQPSSSPVLRAAVLIQLLSTSATLQACATAAPAEVNGGFRVKISLIVADAVFIQMRFEAFKKISRFRLPLGIHPQPRIDEGPD